jgi:hypothetical protein
MNLKADRDKDRSAAKPQRKRTESGAEIRTLADAGGAFDFLKEEPELYSDADLLPNRRNPRFGGQQ